MFNHIDRCTLGWSKFRNACYKYFTTLRDWNSAQTTCNAFRAQLTSIHSQEEADFTADLQNSSVLQSTWIGGRRRDNAFQWIDGTPFDFTYWSRNEPNNRGGNENCMDFGDILFGSFGKNTWNDVPCTYRRNFLCKKQLEEGT